MTRKRIVFDYFTHHLVFIVENIGEGVWRYVHRHILQSNHDIIQIVNFQLRNEIQKYSMKND